MNHDNKGFTLIELLVVMGIMALLMGVGVLGFVGMRRGAELRGGVMDVRTTLMLARQQAVVKGTMVRVSVSSDHMTVTFDNDPTSVKTVYLTPGVTATPSETPVVFSPSGSAGAGSGTMTVTVADNQGSGQGVITIWKLTGASMVSGL